MIQAAYLRNGECGSCNRIGCLLIRAQGEHSTQATSFKLCINCLRKAHKAGWDAWPIEDRCELPETDPSRDATIYAAG